MGKHKMVLNLPFAGLLSCDVVNRYLPCANYRGLPDLLVCERSKREVRRSLQLSSAGSADEISESYNNGPDGDAEMLSRR